MCGSWLLHIMLLKVIYAICLTNIVIQFRALADQFYQSPEHHEFVRQEIVNQVDCFSSLFCLALVFFYYDFGFYWYHYLWTCILLSHWYNILNDQLKSYPEIYEGYVPMAYDEYLEKMSRYSSNSLVGFIICLFGKFDLALIIILK